MNVSFRNSSSSLLSLISVHKSYALKISVLMEPVFVTIGTFDFQLMYFYVGVGVYIYIYIYINRVYKALLDFPVFMSDLK